MGSRKIIRTFVLPNMLLFYRSDEFKVLPVGIKPLTYIFESMILLLGIDEDGEEGTLLLE